MKITGKVKKSDFVKAILGLVLSIFLLCLHCYLQAKTWVIVLMVLLVLSAIYDIIFVIDIYRKQKNKKGDNSLLHDYFKK